MKFCKIQYNYTLYYKYYINEHYWFIIKKGINFCFVISSYETQVEACF